MKNSSFKNDPNKHEFELLPGEIIALDTITPQSIQTDEVINLKYIKGEIRIVTETARYSLAGILSMLKEKVLCDNGKYETRYLLDPEYQRRHRWNNERKSRLIESFLMNVPVPPVFLYERDLARFEVMDGRQRLTALKDFYSNRFKLEGLQYWTELNGRNYSELPIKVRDGIDRRYISSIILLKETASTFEQAAQLKKMVFERLNSGGVNLSSQETRNAIYGGPLNNLCLRLSGNRNFQKMWDIPIITDDFEQVFDNDEGFFENRSTNTGRLLYEKMHDVELVLRFFAYRQIQNFHGGLNKISAFLDRFLNEGNKFSPEILLMYEEIFESTISLLYETLGNKAFCRLNEKGARGSSRPTKIIYDPIMYVASQNINGDVRRKIILRKTKLAQELGRIYTSNKKIFAGRSTNMNDLQNRNECVEKAFLNTIQD